MSAFQRVAAWQGADDRAIRLTAQIKQIAPSMTVATPS
ncbi:hypothetical protein BLA50215_00980 [Burkholderia lata]|nr:hypothetical protein BLA50215_00980 [Burkholderia lata]